MLKRSQTEMKMELKNSVTLLLDLKKNLTNSMSQAEDKTSGLEDKEENLDQRRQV